MANNTGVLYGVTGTRKTTALGHLARHIFQKTQKPVRLVTADGGGCRPIQPYIDSGIIEVLTLIGDPERLLLLGKIVEGYWPKDIEGGKRISKKMLDPTSLEKVGGVFFEGVTSLSEAIHSVYEGKETGMKAAYRENISSDFMVEGEKANKVVSGLTVGSYSMDSYGLVQNIMLRNIQYSWTLPVEYVWWTGHDLLSSDDDDVTGRKVVITGVQLIGKAFTPKIGKHLGTMIHAYKVIAKDKVEVRFYYQTHPDAQIGNVTWEAKPRIPAAGVGELEKEFPGGFFTPTPEGGLDKYIALEETLLDKSTSDVKKWKEEVLKGVKK